MDKIEFSKHISAYLENDLDDTKKKEFELLVQTDPDCKRMLNEVEQLIGSIKEAPKIETSRNFIVNLNKRIDEHENQNRSIIEKIATIFSGDSLSSLKMGLSMSLLVAFSASYLYFSSESISGNIAIEGKSDPKTTTNQDTYIADSDSLYDEYEDDIQLTNGTE